MESFSVRSRRSTRRRLCSARERARFTVNTARSGAGRWLITGWILEVADEVGRGRPDSTSRWDKAWDKCKAMEGLIEEGKQILEEDMEDDVRDAALICAAQRVEHYEIAGYGCARTFARDLGHHEAADILQRTLEEEGAADEKLTEIAVSRINAEAMSAGA